tara:strand:+ start:2045 stop:2251 length:207 start_codon:yes stop_codon:yes gene_type:complete
MSDQIQSATWMNHQSTMARKPVIRKDTPGHVNNVFSWHEHQQSNGSGEAPVFVNMKPTQPVKKGRASN